MTAVSVPSFKMYEFSMIVELCISPELHTLDLLSDRDTMARKSDDWVLARSSADLWDKSHCVIRCIMAMRNSFAIMGTKSLLGLGVF